MQKPFSLRLRHLAIGLAVVGASAQAEVLKIAHIDALSGPAAALARNFDNTLRYAVDIANKEQWAGAGITFEVVEMDGKNNSQESLLQLKNALDQDIRFVMQGGSSSIAAALIESVNRHNERNPGKEALLFSPTNQSPELTNERCSFWYFNFDSNAIMRAEGLVNMMANDKSIKKVYLINQNYALGQQSAIGVKEALKRRRPDVEIAGDDLHPMLQVKDFTPYVNKIRASGADVIITANFSADLTLLIKALKETGLKLPVYAFNASTTGGPTALAAAGVENVRVVTQWLPNDDPKAAKPYIDSYNAKYKDDFNLVPWYNAVRMLAQAVKDSKSTQPAAVAKALEGMKIKTINGEVEMRKQDHQLQQALVVGDWAKVNAKDVPYDMEKTGYGFKVVNKIPAYAASTPTSCQMKRPG
ncbi:branched-chain amino acid ABC transporter substrate-binding protein [Variovorax paradoxus]|nr:branched-chain amino acid ABC transporter substrate-binding protein [Variovorax paradoxus]MBT2301952.1 branched-chain amino acid ABC transporter substrate-binding protein [Variovorax paradoxus]